MIRIHVLAFLLLFHAAVLAAPPYKRIVSLAPNFTELVYAVGAEDALVGVVQYSDYPEAAKALPRIGNAMRVDLERLLVLQPDLIMVWQSGTPLAVQEQLREQGYRLWVREPRHLDDVAELLLEIGELTGHQSQASHVAADYRHKLEALRQRYAGRKPVRLYYQITSQPLMTINKDHLINEAIELCGGRNIFAELPTLTPVVSQEAVYVAAPELIVYATYAGSKDSVGWVDRSMINVPMLSVSADLLHRATPRTVEGVEQLCRALDDVRNAR